MIINANSVNLSQTGNALPNLANPITKWLLPITFKFVTKTVSVNGEVVETDSSMTFNGVMQNLDSKALQVKLEAQRAWTWKMVHSLVKLELDVDDIINYKDKDYRVMNVKDYSEYGYYEYHIVGDYNT